jgi:hypothetical protein
LATLDLLDPLDALATLGMTESSKNSDRVAGMVTGISLHIDKLCGPVVARETVATLSGPYSGPLLLTTTPVYEITEVVETSGVTPTTLTDDDWQLEASGHYARLFRRSGGYDSIWIAGARNVEVTYLAGRFESTATVDEYWKSGARNILVQRWQREASQWQRNPTGDEYLPDGPFDVLAAIRATFPYDLLPPGIA